MPTSKVFALLLTSLSITAFSADAGRVSKNLESLKSPDISEDSRVTFRLRAPLATAVNVWGDWDRKDHNLEKDADGIWSVTVGPLASNIYSYSFHVDGITLADPENPMLKPTRSSTNSVFSIQGVTTVPIFRRTGVKSGVLHLHDYDSTSLGVHRRLRVYTPPAFDAASKVEYPVLYLFHGAGDNEATWSEFGRANVILDNLIADNAVRPMIVVMTDGHPQTTVQGPPQWQDFALFERDLLGDVIPFVESHYPVARDRDHRAIAGLSMGGFQSLMIGLSHRDLFGWVAGMSSAIPEPEKRLKDYWRDPNSSQHPLHLLWLRVGSEDFLLNDNRHFAELLTQRKVAFDYREGPGGHVWPVWRENLAELLPRLFAGNR